MKAQLVSDNKKISVKDLLEFEEKFNVSLPDNYKHLILKYNGANNLNDDMLLDTIYSIKYGNVTVEEDIKINQIIEQNIPLHYLPFAITGTGNEITIYLKNDENMGKIFLFRYDELIPRKIADSLEELLGVKSIEEL